ncbi:MAG: hypothetical protein PF485_09460 [Bacteroidales bacterium]|jgi:hypothetical protein|nr:hypothetical protein [Bacteroidales bacterium]
MIYPEFETDILISVESDVVKDFVEEVLVNGLKDYKLSVEVLVINKQESYISGNWISSTSVMNLYVSDNLIKEYVLKSTDDFECFMKNFKVIIQPIIEISKIVNKDDDLKIGRPFSLFSVFYCSPDNYKFQFLFDNYESDDEYLNALTDVFKTINLYNQPKKNKLKSIIKKTYSQSNGIKYFLYSKNNWTALDPLIEIGKEISENYIKNADKRIRKPSVVLHEDNFRKYIIFDKNWILSFDKLETMMIRPNDVSLYSSICENNLVKAKKFYDETIIPRYKRYIGVFPLREEQVEYLDYFELIISALIFAYTSLEAFANICIPSGFEYKIEKSGKTTIYTLEAIEREFALKDKFKNILKSILNTPDPTEEKWWNDFINLENIRNEIIHAKQSKSEVRYSQLLSRKIFKTIAIHKEIISFYGNYISMNKKELLEIFPYNFGYDNIIPGLTDNENYEKFFNRIHNIKS